jgi:hypothetical protein
MSGRSKGSRAKDQSGTKSSSSNERAAARGKKNRTRKIISVSVKIGVLKKMQLEYEGEPYRPSTMFASFEFSTKLFVCLQHIAKS